MLTRAFQLFRIWLQVQASYWPLSYPYLSLSKLSIFIVKDVNYTTRLLCLVHNFNCRDIKSDAHLFVRVMYRRVKQQLQAYLMPDTRSRSIDVTTRNNLQKYTSIYFLMLLLRLYLEDHLVHFPCRSRRDRQLRHLR